MPTPVSATVTRTAVRSSSVPGARAAVSVTLPASVNLTALWIRLTRIWRNFSTSPLTRTGRETSRRQEKSSPLASAWAASGSATARIAAGRSKSVRFRVAPPDSMAEMSSSEDMTRESWELDSRLRARYSFCSSDNPPVPMSSWVMPMIPLSGVRSSWLMLARNCPLARLALSASRMARSRSISMRLRCTMRQTPSMIRVSWTTSDSV